MVKFYSIIYDYVTDYPILKWIQQMLNKNRHNILHLQYSKLEQGKTGCFKHVYAIKNNLI